MKNILSNRAYDIIKWIAIVVIPALGEAYVRLANVWNLPYGQQINETALVITFLLGALIGISTVQYNKNVNADIEQIGKEVEEEIGGED